VTTVAAGLALTMARTSDTSVLLVDANPKQTTGDGVFKTLPSTSMVDVRHEGADGRTTVIQPNLYILSATAVGEHEPSTHTMKRMEELIDHLRRSDYDVVVLDLPPVIEKGARLRFLSRLDGVNLVVAAETVHIEVIQRAKDLLQKAGVKFQGIIFNKRKLYVPRWIYRKV
jgi:Mrp family chromosome partitioning ATPase